MTGAVKRLDAVWYQGVSLGMVGLSVAIVLALANEATVGVIALSQARDTQLSLEQVLPEGYADNNLLKDTRQLPGPDGAPLTVYLARRGGEIRAVLYELSGKGYAGPVSLVMAVDREGQLLGVRITHHNETPGLGDKIDAAKTDWIHAFEGKSLGKPEALRWAVKKDGGDFDQFAGATITPRAVVRTVKSGLEFFAANQAALLEENEGARP